MPDFCGDQGLLYVTMPTSARRLHGSTKRGAKQVENVSRRPCRGVQYTTTVVGFNLLSFAHTSYNSFFFVTLKPGGEPQKAEREHGFFFPGNKKSAEQESGRCRRENCLLGFSPLAVPGVGPMAISVLSSRRRMGKAHVSVPGR